VNILKFIGIGKIRYIKDSPFIIGDYIHFLPPQMWTKEEKNKLKFCVIKQVFTCRGWKTVDKLKLSYDELKNLK
jgi:hypothetical protein